MVCSIVHHNTVLSGTFAAMQNKFAFVSAKIEVDAIQTGPLTEELAARLNSFQFVPQPRRLE